QAMPSMLRAVRCLARYKLRLTPKTFLPSYYRLGPPSQKIIGLANAGGDLINSIKQAAEFGILAGGQKLAALLVFLTDIHSIGLKTAQGLTLTSAWYWYKDDASRAFAKRFMARNSNGLPPTYIQAGIYTAVAFYLKAIQAAGTDDADT